MTRKICDYHKDFAEDSVLQGCDTSSSAGFWQPRFACMCVCLESETACSTHAVCRQYIYFSCENVSARWEDGS